MSHHSTNVPSTMFAGLYEPGKYDLVIERHHPVPRPGKGEVLLKVVASGVCHTDVLLLSGVALDTRKYILGHEICGTPVELGEGVDHRVAKKGQLYSVFDYAPCVTAVAGFPAGLNGTGVGQDGGYAPYVVVDHKQLLEVPEGVPAPAAAIASDAGITAHHAVHETAGIKHGSNARVLIFGIGGVGHLALQYAKYYGATVYVCDNKPEARELALELGAVEAFDLIDIDQKIKEGFTVDITIDFVANSLTFGYALGALAGTASTFPSSAKLVLVGVSSETFTASEFSLIAANVHILTSLYGSHEDGKKVLELFAKGAVRPVIKTEPLEDVRKVINELRASQYVGRKVLIPK
ncbi:hypothetical protein V5O48_006821 [Marasmius crinis-equi]|uniref:Enoyl reductase (ER) domain-containing protein n=1 Tax=Marasmius crinis-equi TaxID=585013 RepID=A0ABR3FIF5_9AGAR